MTKPRRSQADLAVKSSPTLAAASYVTPAVLKAAAQRAERRAAADCAAKIRFVKMNRWRKCFHV